MKSPKKKPAQGGQLSSTELIGWCEIFDELIEQPDLGPDGLRLLVLHVLLEVGPQLL
ncbi:hypothetical protein [Aeromonas sp. RU39B]|uniref:hypothetical protein n=1 Tax=Aeromonas sp. RU39B TaxID=1907416 RepID=UPI0015C3A32A|nr:hypothetical protein [Aeromonas sp. RU39B]